MAGLIVARRAPRSSRCSWRRRRSGSSRRPAPASSSGSAATAARSTPGLDDRRPVRRPRAAADRPARAGRHLPAAAGDHRRTTSSVEIDTVLYFTITDPKSATYEIANPLQAIEQLTVTTLRNIIGAHHARGGADEPRRRSTPSCASCSTRRPASGGSASTASSSSRSTRRPRSRRRWRSRCAPSATAAPRSSPPRASSSRRSSPPRARSSRRCCAPRARKTAAILRSEGEAKAIDTVFAAIHEGDPDQALLSYQYLQMLPQLAQGDANKVFVIPSEWTTALGGLGGALQRLGEKPAGGQGAAGGRAGARRGALGRSRARPRSCGPSGPAGPRAAATGRRSSIRRPTSPGPRSSLSCASISLPCGVARTS